MDCLLDTTHTTLLDIDEVWKAVRSGVWFPRRGRDEKTTNQPVDGISAARVQNTKAFIDQRLCGLTRTAPLTSHVNLAYLANCGTPNPIDQYSTSDELHCVLYALDSLHSPWRKLPDELLVEVFSWCLPPNAVCTAFQAPLLLTRICSHWHTLSVNSPSLWTSLILTHNFLVNTEAELSAATDFEKLSRSRYALKLRSDGSEFMSTILNRSRTLPLSFSSHSGILLQSSTRQLFYDNFSRLKDLALLVPEPDDFYSPPFPPVAQPLVAPLLETLDIYALQVRDPPSNDKTHWASAYLELIHTSSATLKRINFAFYSLPFLPRIDFNRKWNNLTHVTWKPGMTEHQALTLLRSAPKLIYVSLPVIIPGFASGVVAKAAYPARGDPVVMTHLETLVVGGHYSTPLFCAMTAPNLKHLVHLAPTDHDKEALISFFQRSAAPLETLYLYHVQYSSSRDLLDVFESVEGGVGAITSPVNHTASRGHLKALLVSDGHQDRRLIRDEVMERLSWKPDGSRRAVGPKGSEISRESIGDWACPEELPHRLTENIILFPRLEYLSFYDIGLTTAGKFSAMLRSRTPQLFPVEACDANKEAFQPSVAKLKVFETWHPFAGLNDVSNLEWKEVEALRDCGLIFRLFKSCDSGSSMTQEEKTLLSQYVQKEGLTIRDYMHDIGQFAPISLQKETIVDN